MQNDERRLIAYKIREAVNAGVIDIFDLEADEIEGDDIDEALMKATITRLNFKPLKKLSQAVKWGTSLARASHMHLQKSSPGHVCRCLVTSR